MGFCTIYVLELADNNYYVDCASRPFWNRVQADIKGCGSKRTPKHKFKRVLEHFFVTSDKAHVSENEKTIELMHAHGWRNVRGGDYTYARDDVETHRWWLPDEFRLTSD